MSHVSEKGEGEERKEGKETEEKEEGNRGKKRMGRDGIWNGLCTAAFCGAACSRHGVRARVLRGASCSPSDLGKTIIFRENAKFFGQKTAAETEEKDFLFVKRKKRNSFRSAR